MLNYPEKFVTDSPLIAELNCGWSFHSGILSGTSMGWPSGLQAESERSGHAGDAANVLGASGGR
jgi:hypothetical protein